MPRCPHSTPMTAPRAGLQAVCLLALASASAWAGSPPMRAGLWEVTPVLREVDGKPMPDMSAMMSKQMAQMPPEARARMEAQMKAHGMQMGTGAGGGAMRVCISQDMISSNRWQQQHDGRCTHGDMQQSGNTWSMTFNCQNPDGHGEVRTTFNGGESYTSDMTMTTQHQGQPRTMHMRHDAKWLGTDCGDLKPLSPADMPPNVMPKRPNAKP